jgi:hypothetical protein
MLEKPKLAERALNQALTVLTDLADRVEKLEQGRA